MKKLERLKAKLNRAYERHMRLEDAVKITEVSNEWAAWAKLTEKLLETRDKIKVLELKYELLNQRMKDKEERRNCNGDALTEMSIRLKRDIEIELNRLSKVM